MKFEEVLPLLRKGKLVHYHNWDNKVYIQATPDGNIMMFSPNGSAYMNLWGTELLSDGWSLVEINL